MYNLIKKLGSFLHIKEQDFEYQCTYSWAVIGIILGGVALLYGQIQTLIILSNQGFGGIQNTPYGLVLLMDMAILVILGLIGVLIFRDHFPKLFATGATIFVTIAFFGLHYVGFIIKHPGALMLAVSIDIIGILFGLFCLNDQFNLRQKLLDKFCKRI